MMADATKMEPKEIEKRLLRQYEEDKYGKLHGAIEDVGVKTDLYVGIGIEMYYPSEEEKKFGLNVLDSDNLVVYFRQERKLGSEKSNEKLRVTIRTARNLGYQVKSFETLSEKELRRLGFD
jgi:hypothetical protein